MALSPYAHNNVDGLFRPRDFVTYWFRSSCKAAILLYKSRTNAPDGNRKILSNSTTSLDLGAILIYAQMRVKIISIVSTSQKNSCNLIHIRISYNLLIIKILLSWWDLSESQDHSVQPHLCHKYRPEDFVELCKE